MVKKPTSRDLLKPREPYANKHVGFGSSGTIDKTGHFYHVTVTSYGKINIFFGDAAKYRQNLLRELCAAREVNILFSVTLPNHSHDVLFTPEWKIISDVYRALNSNVAGFIRKTMKERFGNRNRLFSNDPAYVKIDSIPYLFYLGKYTFDNTQVLEKSGRSIPDSCFWMFEKGFFPEPYDARLYEKLFGMSPADILKIYQEMDRYQVENYAAHVFSDWTEEDRHNLFDNST